MKNNFKLYCLLSVFIFNTAIAAEKTESWQWQVEQADAMWWDVAFNHCDEKKMSAMLSDDMEFVHDEIGISRGKAAFIELTMKNVCQYSDMRREVIPGTMSYDPLRNVRDDNKIYGAVISGEHLFYSLKSGQADKLVSRAKFTQVMLFDGKNWKLSRAISYRHRAIN